MMATRYAQGTIWAVTPKESKRGKAGGGLVMIISNSAFNAATGIVNCLAVTDAPQGGKTNVPLAMDKPQFICCEQLQTIPTQDLQQFEGVVSVAALDAVKKKLKAQFDIADEQDYWAGKSFEDDEPASEAHHDEPEAAEAAPQPNTPPVVTEPPKRRGGRKKAEPKPEDVKAAKPPKNPAKAAKAPKAKEAAQAAKPRQKYSPEDVAFILDKGNDVKVLMERYGFKTEQAAYSTRARLKKKEAGK